MRCFPRGERAARIKAIELKLLCQIITGLSLLQARVTYHMHVQNLNVSITRMPDADDESMEDY